MQEFAAASNAAAVLKTTQERHPATQGAERMFLMKLVVLFLTIGVLLLSTSARAADAKAGKTVFDSKCKMCHGANGEGNAALAKTLKVTFPDFASKDVQSKADADLKKVIAEGKGKMQPIKGLTDPQVQDVIAFVRTLAKS